uniref:Uncharacterized protein MANES_11G050700 n=1 Tax=Rhizophora mucronata TaxID=61149 RepID=A0A2P2MF44_RHIMU
MQETHNKTSNKRLGIFPQNSSKTKLQKLKRNLKIKLKFSISYKFKVTHLHLLSNNPNKTIQIFLTPKDDYFLFRFSK